MSRTNCGSFVVFYCFISTIKLLRMRFLHYLQIICIVCICYYSLPMVLLKRKRSNSEIDNFGVLFFLQSIYSEEFSIAKIFAGLWRGKALHWRFRRGQLLILQPAISMPRNRAQLHWNPTVQGHHSHQPVFGDISSVRWQSRLWQRSRWNELLPVVGMEHMEWMPTSSCLYSFKVKSYLSLTCLFKRTGWRKIIQQ